MGLVVVPPSHAHMHAWCCCLLPAAEAMRRGLVAWLRAQDGLGGRETCPRVWLRPVQVCVGVGGWSEGPCQPIIMHMTGCHILPLQLQTDILTVTQLPAHFHMAPLQHFFPAQVPGPAPLRTTCMDEMLRCLLDRPLPSRQHAAPASTPAASAACCEALCGEGEEEGRAVSFYGVVARVSGTMLRPHSRLMCCPFCKVRSPLSLAGPAYACLPASGSHVTVSTK